MTHRIGRLVFGIFAVLVFFAGETFADTFRVSQIPGTGGLGAQQKPYGVSYTRTTGVGLIYFYPSHAATGTAQDEFAKMWRARVEPTLPGAAPQPQVERDGEFTVAVGAKQVDAKGTLMSVSFVALVGKGRAIGVLTMAAGDGVQRELSAFLDTIEVVSAAAVTNLMTSDEIDVDFTVPQGYGPSATARRSLSSQRL